jgi:hypothetical protein
MLCTTIDKLIILIGSLMCIYAKIKHFAKNKRNFRKSIYFLLFTNKGQNLFQIYI